MSAPFSAAVSHGHRMSDLHAKHHLGACCQHHALGLQTDCMKFVPPPCLRRQTPTCIPITASCYAIAIAVRVAAHAQKRHISTYAPGLQARHSIMIHIMSSQEAPSRIGSHNSSISILPSSTSFKFQLPLMRRLVMTSFKGTSTHPAPASECFLLGGFAALSLRACLDTKRLLLEDMQ